MLLLQERHFPCNKSQDKRGILSYQAIIAWQCVQNDRGLKREMLAMSRYARTLRNDPQQRKKGIKKRTGIFIAVLLF